MHVRLCFLLYLPKPLSLQTIFLMDSHQLEKYRGEPNPGVHHCDRECQGNKDQDIATQLRACSNSKESCEEDKSRNQGVDCPSALLKSTEPAGKHETSRNEGEKSNPTRNEVQDAMPADFMGIRRCSGWEPKCGVSHEDPCANQPQTVDRNQPRSPVPVSAASKGMFHSQCSGNHQ